MSPAEICALSQSSLDKLQSLKKEFDVAFEILMTSGSNEDLQQVTVLQEQIENELHGLPVAYSPEHMNNKTLVYIGKLEPGMFHNFPSSIEHLYTSFPETEIHLEQLEIGGRTSAELQELMKRGGIEVEILAKDKMDEHIFPFQKPELIDLAIFRLSDLGFSAPASIEQVYDRVAELGLELCPPAVGPEYCLAHHLGRPVDGEVSVGMKLMDDTSGLAMLSIFGIDRGGLRLGDWWIGPADLWQPSRQLLLRVRKDV